MLPRGVFALGLVLQSPVASWHTPRRWASVHDPAHARRDGVVVKKSAGDSGGGGGGFSISIRDATHTGFVDHDENLMEGEELVQCLHAVDSDECWLNTGALISSTDQTGLDCWLADSVDRGAGPNPQAMGALAILDRLFLCHLKQSGRPSEFRLYALAGSASHSAGVRRGFVEVEDEEYLVWDEVGGGGVAAYTEAAVAEVASASSSSKTAGTAATEPGGGAALQVLTALSSSRHELELEGSPKYPIREATVGTGRVCFYRSLLPAELVEEVRRQAVALPLCVEADSVDHMPSHHRLLLERGERRADAPAELCETVERLGKRILPLVRAAHGSFGAVLCDAFVRRYEAGQDGGGGGGGDGGGGRDGIPAHYDSLTLTTVLVALTPTDLASGGFYVQGGAHASSRRFVTMGQGDCLLHGHDVAHGVDMREGERWSLVLWFSTDEDACDTSAAPWLEAGAEGGDAVCAYSLAALIEGGHGAYEERPFEEAVSLYEQAAGTFGAGKGGEGGEAGERTALPSLLARTRLGESGGRGRCGARCTTHHALKRRR